MYAIIENGGKQYKVTEGMRVKFELMGAGEGDAVTIKEVIVVSDDNGITLGNPYIDGAQVSAKVLGEGKARKVTIFKYKKRKDYKKKVGHRQLFTELVIEKIQMEGSHGA